MSKEARFPGFAACLQMMHKSNPQVQEDGFHLLLPHAGEYVADLMAAFASESDMGLRCWLLELIGEAKSSEAFPLLAASLASGDEALHHWAVLGLKKLDSKEARTLLYVKGLGG